MENMQEGHLPVFLPENKDHLKEECREVFRARGFSSPPPQFIYLITTYCVYQLNELGEEEEPGHSNHLQKVRAALGPHTLFQEPL